MNGVIGQKGSGTMNREGRKAEEEISMKEKATAKVLRY